MEERQDLISRQAAIDCFWTKERFFRDALDVIKDIRQLPPAQPEQRWTPVTEGLPKAGVRYQVTFASGEVGYADFRNKIFLSDGSVKENIWEIERYYEEDGKVIAWKPLPEPYKESE